MRKCVLVAVAIVSLARHAAADDPPPQHRGIGWEAQVALRGGHLRFDEGTSGATGLGARVGIVLGRLALLADYSDLGTSAPSGWTPDGVAAMGASSPANATSSNGTAFRIGALARYAVRSNTKGFLARAWIAAGVGEEIVAWDVGGRLQRPDVALAIGGALGGAGRRTWADSYVEIAMWIAPRSRSGATTCGGPCDVATQPPPFDRSIMIDWGMSFGR